MRLLDVEEGKSVRILNIYGGHGLRNRLASIGLFPGSVLKVVKSAPGPFIIEVSGSRIALGKGMASKIVVEEV